MEEEAPKLQECVGSHPVLESIDVASHTHNQSDRSLLRKTAAKVTFTAGFSLFGMRRYHRSARRSVVLHNIPLYRLRADYRPRICSHIATYCSLVRCISDNFLNRFLAQSKRSIQGYTPLNATTAG